MCICVYSPPKCSLFCVVLCAKGVRKDRIRVIKRDKRRPGNSGRERSSKDVEQKTAPHQDRRKHLSSSGDSSEGRKCAVPGIPPDQVPDILLVKKDSVREYKLYGSQKDHFKMLSSWQMFLSI